jgi:hypothetical protein
MVIWLDTKSGAVSYFSTPATQECLVKFVEFMQLQQMFQFETFAQ